jgi:hypothetical protein
LKKDNSLEPNERWFFERPEYFPWSIMGLDRPQYAPLYSYLCKICSKYEKDADFKRILSGNPSFGQIKKHALYIPQENQSEIIVAIYSFVNETDESKRSLVFNVVSFLEGFQPFREDFCKRLLDLWKSGRIELGEGQLRKKRVY